MLETGTPIIKKRTGDELKKDLKRRLSPSYEGEDGYDIGELIVPRKYQKITYDRAENEIKVEDIIVGGRKRSLRRIRDDLLKRHLRKGIVR